MKRLHCLLRKTVNKQDEVIGTTGCAPLVMMAPLIGLQLTQLQQHLSTSTAAIFPHNATIIAIVSSLASLACSALKLLIWTRYALD